MFCNDIQAKVSFSNYVKLAGCMEPVSSSEAVVRRWLHQEGVKKMVGLSPKPVTAHLGL